MKKLILNEPTKDINTGDFDCDTEIQDIDRINNRLGKIDENIYEIITKQHDMEDDIYKKIVSKINKNGIIPFEVDEQQQVFNVWFN